MPKFTVEVPFLVWVTLEVEAANATDAEDKGFDEMPRHVCGNGGSDKMLAVDGKASISEPDSYYMNCGVDICVTEKDDE